MAAADLSSDPASSSHAVEAAGDTVLVVLAAGAGRRLGGVAKALLPVAPARGQGGASSERGDSESYLARICATARAAGVSRGVVVVGPPHDAAVTAAARQLGLDVVANPEPERGMASSIELGFAWAAAVADGGASAALLWPCDHPAVSPATVRALLAALADSSASTDPNAAEDPVAAVIPTVAGRGGHPALITRALFGQLARCTSQPEGARSVLRASRTSRLPVDDRGAIADVDVSADLAELAARQEVA
jgi:CTP:molybdopterin cytidylyltransferase MocA